MDERIEEAGRKRAELLEYRSFSAYVEHLIQADLQIGGSHAVVRDDAGVRYTVKEGAK